MYRAGVWSCQASLGAAGASTTFSPYALRSSNHAILVSIAAPQPLRAAAGDGRVPGQALVYTQATTAMSPIDAHQILAATSRSP